MNIKQIITKISFILLSLLSAAYYILNTLSKEFVY